MYSFLSEQQNNKYREQHCWSLKSNYLDVLLLAASQLMFVKIAGQKGKDSNDSARHRTC